MLRLNSNSIKFSHLEAETPFELVFLKNNMKNSNLDNFVSLKTRYVLLKSEHISKLIEIPYLLIVGY